MDFFLNKMKDDAFHCVSDDQAFLRCPFLRNINKPTNLSFSPVNLPVPTVNGPKGPIFEDGPNFDLAFKLFHGKGGVVPLSERSGIHGDDNLETYSVPKFNPLYGKTATISLSTFGLGGPFGFNFFNDKLKKQKQKSNSSGKKDQSSQGGTSEHEAYGNEWLHTGNCPIAKSYRAVRHVLPLVAKALQPPAGMKLRCPPAIVAACAALAQTALVKNLRPQPLPAKMLAIAALGMAANVPLGIWREHTQKFSVEWFIAIHAAVPFIAMLRKAVMMPKTAMALTIGASVLGQVIGSRAERIRLKALDLKPTTVTEEVIGNDFASFSPSHVESIVNNNNCGSQQMMLETLPNKGNNAGSSATNICF
ncbi:hypothetical protein RND81_06G212500 [Saponaria officinalis]|uniref:Uncharacterized protein n=1 Tax=Saponaria officinalis TaxID=3572 RepID=A0AAW1KE05_SAPOF